MNTYWVIDLAIIGLTGVLAALMVAIFIMRGWWSDAWDVAAEDERQNQKPADEAGRPARNAPWHEMEDQPQKAATSPSVPVRTEA